MRLRSVALSSVALALCLLLAACATRPAGEPITVPAPPPVRY